MVWYTIYVLLGVCISGIMYASDCDMSRKDPVLNRDHIEFEVGNGNDIDNQIINQNNNANLPAGYDNICLDPFCSFFAGGVCGTIFGASAGGIATIWVKNAVMYPPMIGAISGGIGISLVLVTIGGIRYFIKKKQ